MKRPCPAALGWIGLAGYVVAYNVLAPDGEMLSEGADRALARHRIGTMAAAALVYLHVTNLVPPQADPLHWGFVGAKWAARRTR